MKKIVLFTGRMKYLPIFIVLVSISISMQKAYAQQKMRIISYNILEGMKNDTTAGKKLFANWVKSYDPDILALEECNKFTQLTLEELAHSYGHPYAVIVKEKGYPVGITSKYPIVNIQKINDNMTHGFIVCKINDLNVIVLHLNPHHYKKRREEIQNILSTIAAAPAQKKWIIMGDFNSLSPLDKDNYADGKLLAYLKSQKQKFSFHENLVDDKALDFEVQQKILDFGFKDTAKSMETGKEPKGSRIDYVYVTKDLIGEVTRAHFIRDDFTASYSDHKPVIMEFKHKK